MIFPVECEPVSIWDERVNDDGGWYLVTEDGDDQALIEACLETGAKGLWIRRPDISFVSQLPQLKYLNIIYDIDDIEPIYQLENLQHLSVSSWGEKTLDYQSLKGLKKLGIGDLLHQSQLDGIETLAPDLEFLHIYKFKDRDLTRLSDLANLETLKIVNSFKLESTEGIASLGERLKFLELSYCRKLSELSEIEELKALKLLWLERSKHAVKTLDFAAHMTDLEVILGDTNGASLTPLAGHPALKVLAIDEPDDNNFNALKDIPHLISPEMGEIKRRSGSEIGYVHRNDLSPDVTVPLHYRYG